MGDFPHPFFFKNHPPSLESAQVLWFYSMNSSKVITVAAKRCATVQKYLEFFQSLHILAVKALVMDTVSW